MHVHMYVRLVWCKATSLGTSLNLLYRLAIGVSIFSIYSFSTPTFLALKSDNLFIYFAVIFDTATAYCIFDGGCG